jgi:hypothetical protein
MSSMDGLEFLYKIVIDYVVAGDASCLILPHLITFIVFGENYRLWSSLSRIFFCHPVTSSVVGLAVAPNIRSWNKGNRYILRRVCKIAKNDSKLRHFCLSVRMEQRVSHMTDFHEIWYLSIFRKSVKKIKVVLKSDKNNGYSTWRFMDIYDSISLNSSWKEEYFG